jgi:hypothetical protein
LEELLLVAGTLPWIRTNDPHWRVCCFCTSDHHRPWIFLRYLIVLITLCAAACFDLNCSLIGIA